MEPNWEWYRSFIGVLQEGSLSAAARALGLSQPTIGRHVQLLEHALGMKLFTRSHEGLSATEAALDLHPHAVVLATAAAALHRAASGVGNGVRGTVRITASEVIGIEVLPPTLAKLRRSYPELTVELMLSNSVDDLLHRAADIAVRMIRPAQNALIARRVGSIELGFHARRDYLKRHGTPTIMEDLKRHALIGFDRETGFIRSMKSKLAPLNRDSLAFRADSDLAQLAAIRSGFGIGICQCAIALRDTKLQRVLAKTFSLSLDTWVAMHEDLRDNSRCAVTFAALVEGLSAYATK